MPVFLQILRCEVKKVSCFARRRRAVEVVQAKTSIEGQDPIADLMNLLEKRLCRRVELEGNNGCDVAVHRLTGRQARLNMVGCCDRITKRGLVGSCVAASRMTEPLNPPEMRSTPPQQLALYAMARLLTDEASDRKNRAEGFGFGYEVLFAQDDVFHYVDKVVYMFIDVHFDVEGR